MKKALISIGLSVVPLLAHAQVTAENYIVRLGEFINDYLIPLIFAFAFLFFIWNAAQYFVIGGANEEAQKKAKSLAIWGILAFVLMISIWGVVNMLIVGLNFTGSPVCPDYNPNCKT